MTEPDDDTLSAEKQAEILAAIQKRATRPCPRCGTNNWMTVPGYSQIPVQKELAKRAAQPPPFFPVATIICATCGFVSIHALQTLGLWVPGKDDE